PSRRGDRRRAPPPTSDSARSDARTQARRRGPGSSRRRGRRRRCAWFQSRSRAAWRGIIPKAAGSSLWLSTSLETGAPRKSLRRGLCFRHSPPVEQAVLLVCPKCGSTYTRQVETCRLDGARLVESASDPLIGRTLDRYRMVALLGVGGMARVYRA